MTKKVLRLLFMFGVFCTCGKMQAQTTVKGVVIDTATGFGLPGASVMVKNTSNGTTTDFDGKFSIQVENANAILQFTYMGYVTQEKALNGAAVVNISLAEDVNQLNEIVITALGI